MPLQALAGSRKIFGPEAPPELVVDDRGGDATRTREQLAHAGVKQIGIQPKGQRAWHVAEAVRDQVRSERGQTEGIMGTLKSDKYTFNKPKERLWQTLEMAGPQSILSFNLNKLMRDIVDLRSEIDGRSDRMAAGKPGRAKRKTGGREPPEPSREFCDTL
jgi:hypothetical protein